MAHIEARIVLTGGPCAGKTTALEKIEENLTELGYKVIIVPEAATLMINGGIRCFGDKPLELYKFQDYIIKLQMQNEKLFEMSAKSYPDNTKCVIIYDRGTMDNCAYIDENLFDKILYENNVSKIDLLDRYDMVLHLVSAADGAEEFYTLENNVARKETIEEARELDKRTMNAWRNHSNLHIIDNSTNFDDKMNKVLNTISKFLNSQVRIRKQKKYLVNISNLSKSFLDTCRPVNMVQSYLGNDSYERRLRSRTLDGFTTYNFTVQKQDNHGSSKIYVERRISEKEYNNLLNMFDEVRAINKIRYAFIQDKEKYKLDIFENGTCILECNENSSLNLPYGIDILSDITDNIDAYNYSLAQTKGVKQLTPLTINIHNNFIFQCS